MALIFKILNYIFCLLFFASAIVQFNDPDPVIWIAFYLFSAYMAFEGARARFHPTWNLIAILIFSTYALFLFFDKEGVLYWFNEQKAENIAAAMKASTPWIEETREFFGLILMIISLAVNTWQARATVKAIN